MSWYSGIPFSSLCHEILSRFCNLNYATLHKLTALLSVPGLRLVCFSLRFLSRLRSQIQSKQHVACHHKPAPLIFQIRRPNFKHTRNMVDTIWLAIRTGCALETLSPSHSHNRLPRAKEQGKGHTHTQAEDAGNIFWSAPPRSGMAGEEGGGLRGLQTLSPPGIRSQLLSKTRTATGSGESARRPDTQTFLTSIHRRQWNLHECFRRQRSRGRGGSQLAA